MNAAEFSSTDLVPETSLPGRGSDITSARSREGVRREKYIVICSDGTGNTAIKGRGTNVFKLYEALDVTGHRYAHTAGRTPIEQIAFYDDGVGTESFLPLKLIGGMLGWGLSKNVKDLYTSIVRVYQRGDKLCLFGFSRGAFTVRTLAGLIAHCGILDVTKFPTKASLEEAVEKVYDEYRERYQTKLSKLLRIQKKASFAFSRENCIAFEDPPRTPLIDFIGVWDTVDAVGLPFRLSDMINATVYQFKFPDGELNRRVSRACHALSIDDERESFTPLIWDQSDLSDKRIEQVWFAGVHSNVGGGYPRQGMSLVALDWMMCKAEDAGLRFLPQVRQLYRELGNVDDKLYDPRSGSGIFYRWKPRDIVALCARAGITRPVLHLSTIERIGRATEGYAPPNIPPNGRIVCTCSDKEVAPAHVQAQIEAISSALNKVHGIDGRRADLPLLDELAPYVRIGRVSYWTFLFAAIASVAVAIGYVFGSFPFAYWLVPGSGFLAALVLAYLTDGRCSDRSSQFWHQAQKDLKEALWPADGHG